MEPYNYVDLTTEQVKGYLSRLGLDDLTAEERKPGKELLDRLILEHQMHVPFENMDPYFGVLPLSLEVSDLYEKIVVKRRGGYCFEMNGVFISLLRSLGFDAWSCLCRVCIPGAGIRGIAHRGNIIRIDGQMYFGDVGFGGAMPAGGIALIDGEHQTIAGEEYWVEDQHNGWWKLMRKRRGQTDDYQPGQEEGDVPVLMFQDALADPLDFTFLNMGMYISPESHFRVNCMANLRTDHGFRAVTGMKYREKIDGVVTETLMSGEEERKQILAEKFGIVL